MCMCVDMPIIFINCVYSQYFGCLPHRDQPVYIYMHVHPVFYEFSLCNCICMGLYLYFLDIYVYRYLNISACFNT